MEQERETVDEKKEDQDETFVIQDTGSDDEESDKLRQMMSQIFYDDPVSSTRL